MFQKFEELEGQIKRQELSLSELKTALDELYRSDNRTYVLTVTGNLKKIPVPVGVKKFWVLSNYRYRYMLQCLVPVPCTNPATGTYKSSTNLTVLPGNSLKSVPVPVSVVQNRYCATGTGTDTG